MRCEIEQAEKELQANKSLELESRLEDIRIAEQRCYVLDQKIASQNFKISALKSEINRLDSKYETDSQQLRYKVEHFFLESKFPVLESGINLQNIEF